MKHLSHSPRESGFTLVVVAALFVAFAVIAAATLERNATMANINKRDAAMAQLARISDAIIQYSVFNKSGTTLLYPCPALPSLLSDDAGAKFGLSVSTVNSAYARNCSDTTGDTVTSLPKTTSTGLSILGPITSAGGQHDVIIGMVPVTTLSQYGIGINDAFDPWNNRIMYVVNRKLAYGSSSSVTAAQPTNPTITDARTGFVVAAPDFILISYGRDGKGGYGRSNTSISVTCPDASTVLREENCDRDITALTITGASQTNPIVITTATPHGLATGSSVYITGVNGMTQLNGNSYRITYGGVATTFTLQDIATGVNINGTSGYSAYTSGGTASAIVFNISPTNTSSKATAATYFDDILTWYRQ